MRCRLRSVSSAAFTLAVLATACGDEPYTPPAPRAFVAPVASWAPAGATRHDVQFGDDPTVYRLDEGQLPDAAAALARFQASLSDGTPLHVEVVELPGGPPHIVRLAGGPR